jgi:hypothetical protein
MSTVLLKSDWGNDHLGRSPGAISPVVIWQQLQDATNLHRIVIEEKIAGFLRFIL